MLVWQTIGIDEAVKLVVDALQPFVAAGKLPPYNNEIKNMRRYKNVDVFFHMQEVGELTFHFVTVDDIELSCDLDFTEIDRAHLDEWINDIKTDIDRYRDRRKMQDRPARIVADGSRMYH